VFSLYQDSCETRTNFKQKLSPGARRLFVSGFQVVCTEHHVVICGLVMCRDLNASHNIKKAGERQLSGAIYQLDKAA
jgi:hypothetical protein